MIQVMRLREAPTLPAMPFRTGRMLSGTLSKGVPEAFTTHSEARAPTRGRVAPPPMVVAGRLRRQRHRRWSLCMKSSAPHPLFCKPGGADNAVEAVGGLTFAVSWVVGTDGGNPRIEPAAFGVTPHLNRLCFTLCGTRRCCMLGRETASGRMEKSAVWAPVPKQKVSIVERKGPGWTGWLDSQGDADCSICGTRSSSRHGSYVGSLRDLPAQGTLVLIQATRRVAGPPRAPRFTCHKMVVWPIGMPRRASARVPHRVKQSPILCKPCGDPQ
jgi:hypothetical protein